MVCHFKLGSSRVSHSVRCTRLRTRALAIEARVGAIAREEAFTLQHRKTHVSTGAGAQRVCGVVVNAHPNLPRAEFERLKAQLHRCLHEGLEAAARKAGLAPQALRAHLLGRLAWAAQVNPQNALRLHRLAAPALGAGIGIDT